MREKILLFSIVFTFIITPFKGLTQINEQDSLALVDLYNSTNGAGWINHTNWLTIEPLSTWYGVMSVQNGRVKIVELRNNKLVGSIPSSLGNLSALSLLRLSSNQLSGNIPSSLGNFLAPYTLDLSYNQLSGEIPSSIVVAPPPFNNISLHQQAEEFQKKNEDSLANLYERSKAKEEKYVYIIEIRIKSII